MRKYFYILKCEIMSNFQYVFNVFGRLVGYGIIMFIFLNLWNYLYDDPSQLINGYDKFQMVWYIIITELIWMTLSGRSLCNKICNEVKGGNISYNMNKPFSYVGYAIFSHFGTIIIRFAIYVIFGLVFGYIFLGGFPDISLFGFIAVFITIILALLISTILITMIGLLAFYIEDSVPFYWLYSKFILVLGTLFPIEFFPAAVAKILKFSPIFVIAYGPAKLFVDFSWYNFFIILGAQFIYLGICYLLCNGLYNKGVKKINVNGG